MIRPPRILVADLHRHVGDTVSVAGWAQTLRLQRAVQFVIVRDHTGAVQVTHRRDGSPLEERLEGLSVESAVRVTGRVVANPVVALGGIELIPDEVTVESRAEAPLPVDANTGPEGRLDWRVFEGVRVFRPEPSFTARHATEFTGVDVELAWIDGVEDVMDFEERMLAHVLAEVDAAHGSALAEHYGAKVV